MAVIPDTGVEGGRRSWTEADAGIKVRYIKKQTKAKTTLGIAQVVECFHRK
jgi:hypothetical protein